MKTYTIVTFWSRRHVPTTEEHSRVTGSLSELVEHFKDVLEEGLEDWKHKRHTPYRAYKISQNPKSINALVNALNKAHDNKRYYHNGAIGEIYKLI